MTLSRWIAAARRWSTRQHCRFIVLLVNIESVKTEFRPAFQNLIRDIKLAGRPWDTLLALDTSRRSRRRYVAHMFKHDAQKNGVRILYAKMPEVDPITNVILESVMEALDEYHSLISREEGLAGMAENVRQGFRAGGRAEGL